MHDHHHLHIHMYTHTHIIIIIKHTHIYTGSKHATGVPTECDECEKAEQASHSMRVNATTIKPFKHQRLDQRFTVCKRERPRPRSMFLAPKAPKAPTKPEWENVTTISEAVGKGDPRVRCNHCLKEYNGGCIGIRGRLLANPKTGGVYVR